LESTSSPTSSTERAAGLDYSREGTRGLRSLEHLALWRRIEAHSFDPPGAGETFEDRLAAEQGWTVDFTSRAIDEYRRFAFIYAADGRAVSPPPVVEQVSRLHLLHTQDYWDVFCNQVLARPLHYQPWANAATDQAVLDAYTSTVARCQRHFGEAPADLWPDPITMATTPRSRYRWVDTDNAAVVPRAALYAIAGLVAAIVTLLIATAMDYGHYLPD